MIPASTRPQEVVALIEECLATDPQLRPTAARVRERLRASAG
jgi:hypothetical protein